MGAAPVDFSQLPIAKGKVKALWDAVRTAGVGADGGPAPDPQAQAPIGPANPLPPRPIPQAGPPSMPSPDGPVAAPPPPAPAPGPLPSAARVSDLQGQVDTAMHPKRNLLQKLNDHTGGLLPLIAAGIGAAAGAPSAAIGANTAQQTAIAERDKQRASLIQQVDAAQQTQATEFGAQERAREMADVARVNAGSRTGVADINAGAKRDVADTAADSRRDVAGTNADARRDVAQTQGTTARDVQTLRNKGSYATAIVGANGRIQSAKYAADAALARQDRSFDHSDNKPTADEDRRADLSKSLDTLADRLTDISTRRPELFGPVRGRLTKGKMAVGTSDPDIAELKSIQENLGQISLGAHAMRNAGHIATAADAMANMYNSPEAYRAGLASGKASADTMQTITRPTLIKGKGGAAAKPKANDPLGIR